MKLDLETKPDARTILGVPLRPFTVGHRTLLQGIGSPFVTGSHFPGIGDLLTALLVCSRTVTESVGLIQSGKFLREQEQAAACLLRRRFSLRVRRALRLTSAEFGLTEILAATNAMLDHCESCQRRPDYQAALRHVTRTPAAPCLN